MADILTEKNTRIGEHGRTSHEGVSGSVGEESPSRIREMAAQYARRGMEFASEKSKKAKETTEHYIHEYPWYAVGIALGAGVLVGLLLRRGRSSD